MLHVQVSSEMQRLNCESYCRGHFAKVMLTMDDYCEKSVCGEPNSPTDCKPKWNHCLSLCTSWPIDVVSYGHCEDQCTNSFGKVKNIFKKWCECEYHDAN